MSGSALEGGAIFEGEVQAAIRVGRGVVQQAAPELFAEGKRGYIMLKADKSRSVLSTKSTTFYYIFLIIHCFRHHLFALLTMCLTLIKGGLSALPGNRSKQ